MNKVYTYNKSFSSLILLIANLISLNIVPDDIKDHNIYEHDLFSEEIFLDYKNYEIINLLKKNLTKEILRTVYYVYLSNDKDKEMLIYNFILKGLNFKNEIFRYRNLDFVNKVLKLSSMVSREAHRMKGFLRFRLVSNKIYYAEINPTNNVIELVSNHFKKRLMNEYFIIKDVNRNIYSVYDRNKLNYFDGNSILDFKINLDDNEKNMEDLWKTFFNTIAIKERTNLKCQMNFMPKKYWQNIIEMEDKL